MKPVLILGARLMALEIADVISEIPGVEVSGFVENMDRTRCDATLEGLPVFWIDDITSMIPSHVFICAFGTTHRRALIERAASMGCSFATLVHPSARVSRKSTIGEGSFVSAGVIVAAHTSIGRHVIVNRGALIGHHTTIGDFVSIMPGANIAGACSVGDSAYIGMSAVVLDHLAVGSYSVIGAGSVATRDVPERVQVVGSPARIVKESIEGK